MKEAMQLAYEQTRAHYAAGNPKATDGITCVYLVGEEQVNSGLPMGAQCAVGCRISNAVAVQCGGWERLNLLGSLEGLYSEQDVKKVLTPLFGERNSALFALNVEIQRAHDTGSSGVEELIDMLDDIARQWGLEPAAALVGQARLERAARRSSAAPGPKSAREELSP